MIRWLKSILSPDPEVPVPSDDIYNTKVNAAVAAAQRGDVERVEQSVQSLVAMDAQELLAELCIQVQEALEGQHLRNLMESTTLPLPDDPEVLIVAVERADIDAMHRYADGDFLYLVSSCIALIAALTEGRRG